MPRERRPKRALRKKFVVYCEGETERNYVDGLRAWLSERSDGTHIRIEPECLHGGGYARLIDALSREPDSNCVARIALVDFDRYLNHPEERAPFEELVRFSTKSRENRVPFVLVVSSASFEYALCCHDPSYAGQRVATFLTQAWGYRDAGDCKGDARVWDRAPMRGSDPTSAPVSI